MTISTTSNRVVGIGNGATTIWNYGFLIPDATEVVVQITDLTTGVVTTLTTLQYSITGIGSPSGGTVTYTPAITNNQTITIQRILPVKQLVSLSNQGSFYPTVVEGALDYLTMVCQQLSDSLSRAFVASANGSNTIDLGGVRLTNLASPLSPNDVPRYQDVQAAQVNVNAVPSVTLGDSGKWLKAISAGVYGWVTLTAAAISDATAAGIALLTGANAAAQRGSLGLGSISLLNSIAPADMDRNANTGFVFRAGGTGADSAYSAQTGAATAIVSTSGTNLDFTTGIPAWARRLKVVFQGVSTNGTNNILIQIGNTTFTTTGYLGSCSSIPNAANPANTSFTAGFGINSGSAANVLHGVLEIDLLNAGNYVAKGVFSASNTGNIFAVGGSLALGAVVDRVRVTTVGGTDTFDAGLVTVTWEG